MFMRYTGSYMIRYLTAIFTVFCFFCFAGISAQAQTPAEITKKAEQYLNNLHSMKAEFVQSAGWEKTLSSGTFYLQRPGKLRFDYTPPNKDFVVADGKFIYYYDSELEQQSNAPIGSTLADFILRDDISLDGEVMVSKLEESRADYFLTLVQRNDPYNGSLTLVFRKSPFQLSRWIVADTQGLITKVALRNMQTGVKLDKDLFYYRDPNHGKGHINE